MPHLLFSPQPAGDTLNVVFVGASLCKAVKCTSDDKGQMTKVKGLTSNHVPGYFIADGNKRASDHMNPALSSTAMLNHLH